MAMTTTVGGLTRGTRLHPRTQGTGSPTSRRRDFREVTASTCATSGDRPTVLYSPMPWTFLVGSRI